MTYTFMLKRVNMQLSLSRPDFVHGCHVIWDYMCDFSWTAMKLVPAVLLLGKIAESWKRLTSALHSTSLHIALGPGPLCVSLIYGRVCIVSRMTQSIYRHATHTGKRQQSALSLPKQRSAPVFCHPSPRPPVPTPLYIVFGQQS